MPKLSPRILLSFACVYFFWGSTYVAIRFGDQVLPPLVFAAVRFLIAGPLMLLVCALRGMKLRQSPRDFLMLAAIGILLLGIGNTGVVWAEQYLPSGLAALLIAVIPLYVALIEVVLPHGERLRRTGWIGIGIGFGGLLLLLWPGMREGIHSPSGELKGALITLIAAFGWAGGSVLSRRARVAASSFVAASWQIFLAGLFNAVLLLGSGQIHQAHFSMQAFWSVGWLVVFGSLVTYTSYIYLLEHVPVAKVATYAYVNPVVAVILGAIFLGERLILLEFAGMAAILAAVWIVTSSKLKASDPAAGLEILEAEPRS